MLPLVLLFAIAIQDIPSSTSLNGFLQVSVAGSKKKDSISATRADSTYAKRRANTLFLKASADFLTDRNLAKARTAYLRVVFWDPRYAPAWFNLGVFAEANRDWKNAQTYLRKYLAIAPHGVQAKRAENELELVTKYAAGEISAEESLRARYDAAIQRARIFMASGFYREAVAETGVAQTLDDSRWEAYAAASICMARQKQVDLALRMKQMALDRSPSDKRAEIEDALQGEISKISK